jgi:hypothetical protein
MYQHLAFLFNTVCAMIWNYQPYLILAFDPPQSSRTRHDMGDIGPVDRMCQKPTTRTSTRHMNECVERIRLSQSLNESRLDNAQDKSKPPISTV